MADDRVDEVLRALDPDPEDPAWQGFGDLLRALAHDLNSPLGSLTMDVYSLGESLQVLEEALDTGDVAATRREVQELRDIRSNLDDAARHAVRVVKELRRLGHGVQGGD
ncbi:MAG: hypothetical protein ACQEXJ_04900 [Myxococcota bacterium]